MSKDPETEKKRKLIVNYIVNSIRPLTTVREKSFKELINGLLEKPPKTPITTYDEVVEEIQSRYLRFSYKRETNISFVRYSLKIDRFTFEN